MKCYKVLTGVLASLAVSLSSQAHADVGCPFTIQFVALAGDGGLNVGFTASSHSPYWFLCNVGNSSTVNSGWGNYTVTATACQALFSQLLTARTTNRPVTVWFYGLSDCNSSTLPASGVISRYPSNFVF